MFKVLRNNRVAWEGKQGTGEQEGIKRQEEILGDNGDVYYCDCDDSFITVNTSPIYQIDLYFNLLYVNDTSVKLFIKTGVNALAKC